MSKKSKKIGLVIPHFSDETGCYLSQVTLSGIDYQKENLRKVSVIKNAGAGIVERAKFAIKNSRIYANYLSRSFEIGNISVSQNKHLIAFYDGLYYSANSGTPTPMSE